MSELKEESSGLYWLLEAPLLMRFSSSSVFLGVCVLIGVWDLFCESLLSSIVDFIFLKVIASPFLAAKVRLRSLSLIINGLGFGYLDEKIF